eukprot:scaffold98433_cov35-Tisochrysis_lutea.AAC.1
MDLAHCLRLLEPLGAGAPRLLRFLRRTESACKTMRHYEQQQDLKEQQRLSHLPKSTARLLAAEGAREMGEPLL